MMSSYMHVIAIATWYHIRERRLISYGRNEEPDTIAILYYIAYVFAIVYTYSEQL